MHAHKKSVHKEKKIDKKIDKKKKKGLSTTSQEERFINTQQPCYLMAEEA